MVVLTKKDLRKMEENYYWSGYKSWYPFPKELKKKLLEVYGEEPFPYSYFEQDIYEGSRKIFIEYSENKNK
ncbi:hypothetical protein QTL97_05065 [Sporosarcina thermotolerans]|uniref:Uncharacterized protein n=1 Tax=Sporosarcina thermotolerans TaxID=633404 RepID=A0AAW9A5U6_9BACL|nr:hypothetical protein [Sporosarcina thermotolerans]MDW0116294.1 hypothetical protein [Sporosarcina thermotolerans]WHT48264.1 hypothetical protein QNH10_20015 [Sporosarcina thermotolerans]